MLVAPNPRLRKASVAAATIRRCFAASSGRPRRGAPRLTRTGMTGADCVFMKQLFRRWLFSKLYGTVIDVSIVNAKSADLGVRMRWLIGIVIVAAIAAAGAWHFIGHRGTGSLAAVNATAAAPVAVEAGPVKLTTVRRQIEAVGSLRSNESVIMRPEISGRITEILFDEGQQVRKGVPLFRLDAAIARAQVEQAKASLILSRANHERAEDLYRRGAGTQRARDEAIAKLHADDAALALAQATLDKATLLAPFDGVIGLRKVSVGDYVNPGQDLVNFENLEAL